MLCRDAANSSNKNSAAFKGFNGPFYHERDAIMGGDFLGYLLMSETNPMLTVKKPDSKASCQLFEAAGGAGGNAL